MIVLDADVLIAHLDSDDAQHTRATELLVELRDEPFASSVFTLAEVLVGPARSGRLTDQVAALARLKIASVGLDSESAVQLATIRAETGLKLPDSCVLQAAESRGADVATFDDKLTKAARRRGTAVHQ